MAERSIATDCKSVALWATGVQIPPCAPVRHHHIMDCNNCGKTLSLNSKFCGQCGFETATLKAASATGTVNMLPEIKCGTCGYQGTGAKNRSTSAQIVAWLCFFIWPLATLFYYILTKKICCPQCKSTFIGVKDESNNFIEQKTSIIKTIVILIVCLALFGILSGVVLTSINQARMKNHTNTQNTQENLQSIQDSKR